MQTTLATVLRIRPFREHDRLFTLYTKDFGKMTVVGRGMQKVRSKLAAHLREFAFASVTTVAGKRFNTITAANIEELFPLLYQDIRTMAVAGSILESYDWWTKDALPDRPAWELLHKSFASLQSGVHPMIVRWAFPLKFLSLMGWHLPLEGRQVLEIGEQKFEITSAQHSALHDLQQKSYEDIPITCLQSRTIQHIIRTYLLFHRDWESKVERWGSWAFTVNAHGMTKSE